MASHTPAEEMDLFKDKPLNFAPGTQWQYSNSNYTLLGVILEAVTGRRYVDLLHDRILAPLGMKDSGIDEDDLILPGRAEGYQPGLEGDCSRAIVIDVCGLVHWIDVLDNSRFAGVGTGLVRREGSVCFILEADDDCHERELWLRSLREQ